MANRWARGLVTGLCFVGGLAIAARADATPLPFGSNYYELVLFADPAAFGSNTWSAANTAALVNSYLGASGHLATITSQAENDFLLSLAPATTSRFVGAWLGGTGTTTSPPNQPGTWLEGPEAGQLFTFKNWGGIEPNNAGLAYMNIGLGIDLGADGTIAAGQWADDSGTNGTPSGSDPVVGYFIEYESPQQVSAVPEPTTISLVGMGVVGLWVARRRR